MKMGCWCVPSQPIHNEFDLEERRKQDQVNKIINKELKKEKEEYDLVHRLLLLGKLHFTCYLCKLLVML